jgi:flagellar protein FliS
MAVLNAKDQRDAYRQQSVMTASPGELTLMLYDGCIRFLKLSKMYMEEKDYYRTNENSKKAQAILDELICSLDTEYEVSTQLFSLYTYIQRLVRESNLQKEPALVDGPLEMITDLRDTWSQAIKLNRQQSMGAAVNMTQSI